MFSTENFSAPSSGSDATINALPPEMLEHIMAHVDVSQIASVRLVSQAFNVASTAVHTDLHEPMIRLAREVADESTGDLDYPNLYHPCARLINSFLSQNPTLRGQFNDAIIAAWMDLNDVDAVEMATWLDHHLVLHAGPAVVHPVQLAYCLSRYYPPSSNPRRR